MNTTLRDSTRKPLFARGPGLALNFFVLAVLSIALMVSDGIGTRTAAARAWAAWALQPLLWVAQAPDGVVGFTDNFTSRDTLLAENRQLKEREFELSGKLLKLDELTAENERIRALLASSAQLPDRVLISEVLATSQDPYRHQIVLNRGTQDGVYKGQALVDAEGVMGQVIQVNPTTCVALLITDPDHGIPVEINRTGLETIALGRGDGQGLSLPYLPGNADVKVGDLLVSSGLGERFPAGYPVGKIFELRHPAGENFMEALAYPTAKLNQGRQALLVWSQHSAQASDVVLPLERAQIKHPATAASAPPAQHPELVAKAAAAAPAPAQGGAAKAPAVAAPAPVAAPPALRKLPVKRIQPTKGTSPPATPRPADKPAPTAEPSQQPTATPAPAAEPSPQTTAKSAPPPEPPPPAPGKPVPVQESPPQATAKPAPAPEPAPASTPQPDVKSDSEKNGRPPQ